MKRISRRDTALLVIGAFVMSLSFILQRFFVVTDTLDGLLKGAAVGFMMLSLLRTYQDQKTKQSIHKG